MPIPSHIRSAVRARLVARLDQYFSEAEETEDDNVQLQDASKRFHDFIAYMASIGEITPQSVTRTTTIGGRGGLMDDIPEAWKEVVGNRRIKDAVVCEFGLAEEVICMFEFTNEEFEVGIGEAIRPYIQLYLGMNAQLASKAFIEAVIRAACS